MGSDSHCCGVGPSGISVLIIHFLVLFLTTPKSNIFHFFQGFKHSLFYYYFFFTLKSFEKSSKNSQRNYSIINSNLVESFFVWLSEILAANDVLTSQSIVNKILELSRFQLSIGSFEQEGRRRQHIISLHLKSSMFDEKNNNTARASRLFGTFRCPHLTPTVKFPFSRFMNRT